MNTRLVRWLVQGGPSVAVQRLHRNGVGCLVGGHALMNPNEQMLTIYMVGLIDELWSDLGVALGASRRMAATKEVDVALFARATSQR